MRAVILAGGLGTRLRPVTGEHPKPMVPLLGRPMMEYIVDRLRDSGFTQICAALHYRAGEIMAHFGDGRRFGVELEYRIETENLGTAGSIKNCRDFVAGEDFLIISGDAACDFALEKLMRAHKEKQAAVTIALSEESLPLRYGLAVTDGEGRIRSFIEKPEWPRVVTDLVNTGIYVVSPSVLERIRAALRPGDGGLLARHRHAAGLLPLLRRRAGRKAAPDAGGELHSPGDAAGGGRTGGGGMRRVCLPGSGKAHGDPGGADAGAGGGV